ncbi:hypothetical protein B296_00016868 [Ensete ventricosum]|uniref:Uncharacterized protein n=1 Tax=Ensete ventricosum TaxID=4639 RepID=A0A426ZNE7_ENSVE|nr:hypothetical protein B296_00016868 [Ensete ventricosum]
MEGAKRIGNRVGVAWSASCVRRRRVAAFREGQSGLAFPAVLTDSLPQSEEMCAGTTSCRSRRVKKWSPRKAFPVLIHSDRDGGDWGGDLHLGPNLSVDLLQIFALKCSAPNAPRVSLAILLLFALRHFGGVD